ncbi:hypothetical protein [Agrobacterium vitis]|uniref:hypothetical protein n=1 Tax=Agrobacterium vitis TaxID=373 RepID=UPI0012E8618E|nr:hypothetical protein [Agrobacterium vitis]
MRVPTTRRMLKLIMGKVIASLTASVNGKKPANAAGGAHFRSICARLADKTIYRILTAGGYHRWSVPLPTDLLPAQSFAVPGPSQMSAFCKTLIFHFLAPLFPPHPPGRIAVTR